MSVLLGNGDGTFAAPLSFPPGDSPFSVTTGDFNGDGLTDLATASFSDDVWVLLNQCTPASSPITEPDSYKFLDGVLFSGQLSDLFVSDDLRMELDPSPTTNPDKQIVDLVLQSSTATLSPSGFSFLLESRMLGGPSGDVIQSVYFYNYLTQREELVDQRFVANTDDAIEITPGGDASRFVQQFNGEITARVAWITDFSDIPFNWSVDVDQAVWSITEGQGRSALRDQAPTKRLRGAGKRK